MEITLEKIELVKDRTGVSYKEAKEALESCDGSVVDAIIAIEESIDDKKTGKANDFANETISKIKELVKKGNISKISVKKDDETIVNIPVNVGIVGTLVAPWGVVAASIAAFGFKCKIELTTEDGKIIDISQKAEGIASDVVEKGSVVIDEVVAKAPGVAHDIKEKGVEAYESIKDVASEKINEYKNKKDAIIIEVEEFCDEVEDACEGYCQKAEEACESAAEKVEEACECAAEKVEEACESAAEKVEEACEQASEKVGSFWGKFTKKEDK